MAYKCPLCLNELKVQDELIRYCYMCDRADFVKGSPEVLRNNLKCKKSLCKTHGQIKKGVYFVHLNCEKPNPFWNGQKLNVPDNAKIDGTEITLPFDDFFEDDKGAFKSFKHWQIDLLSKTINSKAVAKNSNGTKAVSEIREMWFPAVLLKATDEKRLNKKLGQIVALVGTKGAGKTFLALQALDKEGYINPRSNSRIEIDDYIYSDRRVTVTIQPIFELLRLRSFMQANRSFPPLQATVRETLNFYAAFFSPTQKGLQKKEKPEQNQSAEQPKSLADRFWELVKKAFALPQSSKKPFYFTLALCDVAGEDVEKEVEQIDIIKNGANKIALVIDATDFIEIKVEEKGILADHLLGLRKLKDEGKPFCVVLTKMDLFAQYLKTHPAFNFEFEKSLDSFYSGNQAVIKESLKKWRETVALNSSVKTPINLLNLLNEIILLNQDSPIFPVETQNLPTDPNAIINDPPFSRGIDTFVCWCLEIERSDIVEEI
jgi:GTPase SAR1 family protein